MIEGISIQYVTDEAGNKKAVLIPYQDWELIQDELKDLLEYRRMKASLKSAFKEVKQIQSGKLPRRTMKTFLDEC